MSKLSSLMVMIGICAFLGNKPAWASPPTPSAISSSVVPAREVQFVPAVAEQFEHTPNLIVVGGALALGLGVMGLRRKPA